MKRFTRGFTLIELLVVIAIIGILASVVLVSLQSARKKGNDSRVMSDVQQMRMQLESDYTNGVYAITCPASVAFCSITNDAAGAASGGTWGTNANYVTLAKDAYGQNGSGLIVTAKSTSTAGASPVTAFAVYGALPSSPSGALKYFCIDSTGNTNPSTAKATAIDATNAGTCVI
jgi:prepilin-type N-terminal cleavage/methylation domain-containing protein